MTLNRILLSGASGTIGTTVVRKLTERHISFCKLVRHSVSNNPIEIPWNPTADNPISDLQKIESFSAVIHLSGANIAGHSWSLDYKRQIILSRVRSTRCLSNALARLDNKPKALLCASAVGFYGNRDDEILTENSSRGNGFLSELCEEWEEATEAAEKAGIRVVHLRFGIVLDATSGALHKMILPFRFGLGGRLGSGRQWMSWISSEDVGAAILFLLQESSLRGPVNMVSPNPVTNATFTRALGRQLRRPTFFPIPAFLLKGVFGEMAEETMLASTRVQPERLQNAGYRFHHETIEAALRAALR